MENVEDNEGDLDEDQHMQEQSEDDEEVESDDDDDEEDDEIESDDADDNGDSHDEDSDSDDDEDIGDGDAEEYEDEIDPDEDWEQEGQYDVFGNAEEQLGNDNVQGPVDNDLDNWDQIEAPPFGEMMFGGRRRRGKWLAFPWIWSLM